MTSNQEYTTYYAVPTKDGGTERVEDDVLDDNSEQDDLQTMFNE